MKRIQRLMKLMGLASVAPAKKTSIPSRENKIYPYLLRNLNINRANQVWCGDITYIRLRGGFAYLTVIKDYETVQELIEGLRMYFEFYNNERPHQSFDGKTPADPAEVYWSEETFKKAA